MTNDAISRRGFVGLGLMMGAGTIGAGLAGCAPSTGSTSAEGDLSDTGQAVAEDWLGAEPQIDEIAETKTVDLLIIGAGNAGLAAAATAADLGLDFMLCEKSGAVQGARMWIGAVNTKYHDAASIEVDEGKLLNELARYASFKCNQRVWRTWIRESAEMIDWLDGIMGAEAELDTVGYDHATGGTDYYVPPIQHMYSMDADDRNSVLEAYINAKGHEVSFGHELVKLLREESGPVTGAIFATDNGYTQVNAANTILATGGYPANRAMVRSLAPIITQCVTADGFMPGNDGSGIKAGLWAGAKMDAECAPMIFDRGAVLPGTDAGYESDDDDACFQSTYGGIGQFGMGSQPFMKVSRHGRRFANESTPYDFICHAAAQQPGGVWCQIFDANAVENMNRFSTVGCSKGALMPFMGGAPIDEAFADELERGFVVKADTIEELADGLGFTDNAKSAFIEEVDRYNTFYDNQFDEEFGKEAFRLSSLKTPPFYGCWYGGTLLTTVDGLCINEDMQVLDEASNVIEGLYAAGDCSGSLFSGNYPEYLVGCACGRTVTFGRHAVKHAAGQL